MWHGSPSCCRAVRPKKDMDSEARGHGQCNQAPLYCQRRVSSLCIIACTRHWTSHRFPRQFGSLLANGKLHCHRPVGDIERCLGLARE